MRDLLHTAISAMFAPGHVRIRDHAAFWLTYRVPVVYRIRARWSDRSGRPGFRAGDFR